MTVRPPFIEEAAAAAIGEGRAALFLDRDGVLNHDSGYVHRAEDTVFYPAVLDVVKRAANAGMVPVIVTNQAGIARNFYTESEFLKYTEWFHAELRRRGIDCIATYYCPHHPTEGIGSFRIACACRKPAPGMITAAIARFGFDPARSMLFGDKESDLVAARSAGVGRWWRIAGGVVRAFPKDYQFS